jgi:hypothetical protein
VTRRPLRVARQRRPAGSHAPPLPRPLPNEPQAVLRCIAAAAEGRPELRQRLLAGILLTGEAGGLRGLQGLLERRVAGLVAAQPGGGLVGPQVRGGGGNPGGYRKHGCCQLRACAGQGRGLGAPRVHCANAQAALLPLSRPP